MLESEAMALLVMTQGIYYAQREAALSAAGSALEILRAPRLYARQLGAAGVNALVHNARDAQGLLERLAQDGVHLLARGGEGYPRRLLETRRPPHLLFVQGERELCDPFPLAIVGTRRASEYGLQHTHDMARELAAAGVCVVSGLALGIDAASHMGALDAGGRTIAVLGGALDRFYPMENDRLRERILACGGSVVSEYPPGMPPTKWSFLERNRIIAGMSLGVLVTEGPRRSGAMRTAREALHEGREVFALPGSVDSVGSQLPHTLIADGAQLVTGARDILDTLVIEPAAPSKLRERDSLQDAQPTPALTRAAVLREPERARPEMPAELSGEERAVYAALQKGEMDFDALCEQTGISGDSMGALLMMMELDGHIRALPGLRYALE